MSLGDENAKTVRRLLNERGYDVTFRRVTGTTSSDYDTTTGGVGSTSNDDETVKVVFIRYRETEIDGETIKRGDRRALVSAFQSDGTALSKTPQNGDQLIGEGDQVNVEDVRTLKDGGTLVGYELQVRE